MSAAEAHFYCDQATRAALLEGGHKVLLLGSYGGFSNFGDVLQLKGAIQWHRASSGLEPVLICHTTAIPDAGFCARQRSWFDVRAILYWSPQRQDMRAAGLEELSDVVSIPRLHVYGGGFLNRYWGSGTVASIEGALRRFGVCGVCLKRLEAWAELSAQRRQAIGVARHPHDLRARCEQRTRHGFAYARARPQNRRRFAFQFRHLRSF